MGRGGGSGALTGAFRYLGDVCSSAAGGVCCSWLRLGIWHSRWDAAWDAGRQAFFTSVPAACQLLTSGETVDDGSKLSGLLPLTWEPGIEFYIPDFRVAQPWLLRASGE